MACVLLISDWCARDPMYFWPRDAKMEWAVREEKNKIWYFSSYLHVLLNTLYCLHNRYSHATMKSNWQLQFNIPLIFKRKFLTHFYVQGVWCSGLVINFMSSILCSSLVRSTPVQVNDVSQHLTFIRIMYFNTQVTIIMSPGSSFASARTLFLHEYTNI